jgi:NitT/TauT family transport system permease protein
MIKLDWIRLASVALLLATWWLAAVAADSRLVPGPQEVGAVIWDEAMSGRLAFHLTATLLRVAAGFVLAFFIGAAIGIAMGRIKSFDRWFDPWMVILLNMPALVTIILAYVWFGLIEVAAIAAVALNKMPNVVVTVREGVRTLDRGYFQLAEIYQLPPLTRLRRVVLPQLYPYLMATTRSGLALIWKIVLVVELLGRSNGVGFQLQIYFQLFDVAGILAYAVAFIVVVQMIELGILRPIDRRLARWR